MILFLVAGHRINIKYELISFNLVSIPQIIRCKLSAVSTSFHICIYWFHILLQEWQDEQIIVYMILNFGAVAKFRLL